MNTDCRTKHASSLLTSEISHSLMTLKKRPHVMYGRFSALYFTYSVCLKKSMPLFPVSFILVSDIIKSVLQRSQHLLRLPLQSLPDAAAWCGYLLLQKSPEHLQHSLLLQKYILLHPLSPVPEPALYSERFQQQQRLPPEKSAALPLSFYFGSSVQSPCFLPQWQEARYPI